MKKTILSLTLLLGVTLAVTDIRANEASGEAIAEQPGKWEKAGKELSEATHAVGDATVDSSKKAWEATKEGSAEAWDATKEGSSKVWEATKEESAEVWDVAKEGSAEAWESTKEKSTEWWEQGKAKVHDSTAPEPPAAEIKPEAAEKE